MLGSPGHGLRGQLGWLPLAFGAESSPQGDLAQGPGKAIKDITVWIGYHG